MAGDSSSIIVAFIHPERGITFYSTEVYGFITSWVPWRLADGFKGQGQEVHEVMLVQDRP